MTAQIKIINEKIDGLRKTAVSDLLQLPREEQVKLARALQDELTVLIASLNTHRTHLATVQQQLETLD